MRCEIVSQDVAGPKSAEPSCDISGGNYVLRTREIQGKWSSYLRPIFLVTR